ncbi:uncharacterized protein EKO05_0005579 [Ascochyta rabiei]|uniref:uncharacterized protein n=1 Tax=Didymella rabiei TaxID=5454 RepID=UPI0021F973EA|nr:uncharacterized protein EKO05_0005579 [Ascochyta rabiei]UPX15120.1 hypothetical protein EKO05_0005579 [Ascochyta rabiei]
MRNRIQMSAIIECAKCSANSNMRAARYYEKEDIGIEHDVADAKCGAGQVRVAPAYVGFCGLDLQKYLGGPIFAPTTPHPSPDEKAVPFNPNMLVFGEAKYTAALGYQRGGGGLEAVIE